MSSALGNNYGKFYGFESKPVIVDCNFIVDSTNGNGLGIRSLKGQGVKNVFMHTSATPGKGPNGYLNPNPAAGFALLQISYNYVRYYGGFSGFVSPVAGSNIAINASALTIGQPYVITSVGHGTAGAVTIAPVADSSGSLASTWFSLYDSYGNTFIIWFSVSGVGSAPVGVSGTLVQQSISTGDTAATIGTDLAVTINALKANTPQNPGAPNVASFTATGTTTVTVTNTVNTPFPGAPADGVIPTGFTFAQTEYTTNLQDWQKVGLPPGVVPNLGASFVATATGYSTGGGSTGLVKVPGVSAISSIEVVGDPNQSIAPIAMGGSSNAGGWILVQFLAPTISGSAFDTPFIPTAPAAGSVVGMSFVFEQATEVGGRGE